MNLPHRAPIGALRTQAGVKRNPCKKEPPTKQKIRQKFCRPSRGFNLLVHPLQGFRFAPPPACVLSPLSGLAICSYILCRGFAPLHHLPVFCRPVGACNLLVHPLQEFRYATPPACVLSAPIGACNNNQNKYDANKYVIPL